MEQTVLNILKKLQNNILKYNVTCDFYRIDSDMYIIKFVNGSYNYVIELCSDKFYLTYSIPGTVANNMNSIDYKYSSEAKKLEMMLEASKLRDFCKNTAKDLFNDFIKSEDNEEEYDV